MSDSLQLHTVSSVHEIFQTRILERVTVSYFRGFSGRRNRTYVSCIGWWILLPLSHWEVHMTPNTRS